MNDFDLAAIRSGRHCQESVAFGKIPNELKLKSDLFNLHSKGLYLWANLYMKFFNFNSDLLFPRCKYHNRKPIHRWARYFSIYWVGESFWNSRAKPTVLSPAFIFTFKISHLVSDWDPRTFKILLIAIGCCGLTLYFYLALKVTNELSITIIVTTFLIINENFLIADATGEITQFEFFFCSIFFWSLIIHKQQNSNFLTFYCYKCSSTTFGAWGKVSISFYCFYLAFDFKSFLKLSLSVVGVLGLLYLYLNRNNVEDFIEITYLVGRVWNSPLYLITNPIETFNDTLMATDPVTAL